MFFDIILTTFIILTLVILFKIFYIEQAQRQQYLNLTREFHKLGQQLEKFNKFMDTFEMTKVDLNSPARKPPETDVAETSATAPPFLESSAIPVVSISESLPPPLTPVEELPREPMSATSSDSSEDLLKSPDTVNSAPPLSTTLTLLMTAQDILKSLWSWIIVGEEHRSKNVSIEYAIATTWLLRFGVLAILFAMGYFLKYSIVKAYFVPWVRIAITLLTGFNMLLVGLHLLRGKYYLIGQGLLGGGLAVLYVSIYAGTFLYQFFSLPMAFAGMLFITVTVAFLAIQEDSLLLAILAILGGYATPLMLWAGPLNLILLYSYLLLLGLGILVIGHYKQWRLLNYLAFTFNYLLFFVPCGTIKWAICLRC